MPAIKLSDVALRAQVSQATASRVINGSTRRPAQHIAKRVRAAAVELGYVANAQAQALVRSSTGLLGLVVHDLADPYFSTIASGVQAGSHEHGSLVLVASTGRHPEGETEAAAAFASYRTDAIILAGSRETSANIGLEKVLSRYMANGGKVVTIGESEIEGVRSILMPNRRGGREIVKVLLSRGIDRFVILGGPKHLKTVRDREAGYLEELATVGLMPILSLNGDFTRNGGYESAHRCAQILLEAGELPQVTRADAAKDGGQDVPKPAICLLVGNDIMAIGAIAALRELGIDVPEQVQVVGFDDIPTLGDYWPGLTTYRLPLSSIGEYAAAFALAAEEPRQPPIAGEVLVRASAG